MRPCQSEEQSVPAVSACRKRPERRRRALKGVRFRNLIDPEIVVDDERLDRCRDKKHPQGHTGKKPCEQGHVEGCQSLLPFEHTVLPRGGVGPLIKWTVEGEEKFLLVKQYLFDTNS
jgi:hypothetical protein